MDQQWEPGQGSVILAGRLSVSWSLSRTPIPSHFPRPICLSGAVYCTPKGERDGEGESGSDKWMGGGDKRKLAGEREGEMVVQIKSRRMGQVEGDEIRGKQHHIVAGLFGTQLPLNSNLLLPSGALRWTLARLNLAHGPENTRKAPGDGCTQTSDCYLAVCVCVCVRVHF